MESNGIAASHSRCGVLTGIAGKSDPIVIVLSVEVGSLLTLSDPGAVMASACPAGSATVFPALCEVGARCVGHRPVRSSICSGLRVVEVGGLGAEVGDGLGGVPEAGEQDDCRLGRRRYRAGA
jgi:hypothetical protein